MSEQAHQQLAKQLLGCRYEELSPVQRSVIDLIATEAPSGVNKALKHDDRTFGARLADHVAAVGGSWGFIIGFGVFLTVWMAWNVFVKGKVNFDPYPFIFLNLMLSMLAAIQAPVIMMSQNRAAARDREAAEHDYLVNLRAELEIMHLHDKVDEMRDQQMIELLKQQREAIRLLKGQVEKLAAKAKI
ncbi:DUF1003 domain-containing protein [Phenylobacterium sp.]|uniref:DUF1003 domain-containing protein n=1 Tax=Phenylobacterium sp. TaxID=1871053 RepID=UPI00122B0DEB|nr:DUF1003 domain-containing protein [Phenylobacterium sp.]THD64061.1 MAG: DUF1003 domain-containing protein [Phenylobacterium sp.]